MISDATIDDNGRMRIGNEERKMNDEMKTAKDFLHSVAQAITFYNTLG